MPSDGDSGVVGDAGESSGTSGVWFGGVAGLYEVEGTSEGSFGTAGTAGALTYCPPLGDMGKGVKGSIPSPLYWITVPVVTGDAELNLKFFRPSAGE